MVKDKLKLFIKKKEPEFKIPVLPSKKDKVSTFKIPGIPSRKKRPLGGQEALQARKKAKLVPKQKSSKKRSSANKKFVYPTPDWSAPPPEKFYFECVSHGVSKVFNMEKKAYYSVGNIFHFTQIF